MKKAFRKASGCFFLLMIGLGIYGIMPVPAQAQVLDEQTIENAYVYLLGRALVIRQEHMDIQEDGVDYNVIKYNPIGATGFVNPCLDVAYLEAWIAVNDEIPALLEVPSIEGRYYTVQICDEWGEVITNINERTFPLHPHGRFAFVAPGSNPELPPDAVRIELHSQKAKMLARVELQTDPQGAVLLQKRFKLKVLGEPKIQPAVSIPVFNNRELIGVELFDIAEDILKSALDISPLAAQMQAKVQAVSQQVRDQKNRAEIDELIRTRIVPKFLNYVVTGVGIYKNSWVSSLIVGNYGKEYWVRTAANMMGIWANTTDEVIYFVARRDAEGNPLNGSNKYVIEFPAMNLPDTVVDAFWSVSLVDVPGYRVVPNPLNRFNLNSYSRLKPDDNGSLKVYIAPESMTGMPEQERNWLPAPTGKFFSLTFRVYVPKIIVKEGRWSPPAVRRLK